MRTNSATDRYSEMSLRSWCRCRWELCFFSTTMLYFLVSIFILGTIGSIFAWLTFSPYARPSLSSIGCNPDSEGSWSVGIYYGNSPFTLRPIESKNVWNNESAAWPIANPIITCASPSKAGFPSNFVADPFLFIKDDAHYIFFETKNSVSMQGDIGVARSTDNGATWQQLGIALDEEWHLSYPYVFKYLDQIYMMPEGSKKGDLRLYRAVNFPLQWTLEKVILKKPLIDAVIIKHEDNYWLMGSDFRGFGIKKNGQLEIWYSNSPLGTWKPHKKNPVYNINKRQGARNAGRPFVYNGNLYRLGQDCGETYGRAVRVFRVDVLNKDEFHETEVSLDRVEPDKGRNSWNGARYHHLDVQQLSSGEWIGVMDGDRVPSGDSVERIILGFVSLIGVALLVVLAGILIGAVNCFYPPSLFYDKREHMFSGWDHSHWRFPRIRRLCTRMNRVCPFTNGRMKMNSCARRFILTLLFVFGVFLLCVSVKYIYGGNGSAEAYQLKDHYSQFTLLTMTYDARLWNLKMYLKHYSKCSSVREIVVVWNKGKLPNITDMDSVVPVRIREEGKNSLSNRFKMDPLIKTRAVLELDDDIMMTCDDVERGFKVWREHSDRIVGFYPRLIAGRPLQYRDERYARRHKGYNMILTGAAFIDSSFAFKKYWSEEAREGRELVDKYFNCEDVLLNFLYVNSSSSRTVEYVKPAWAIDTSKFSGVAISRNTWLHYQIRTNCLIKFSQMYGSLDTRKYLFNSRKDGWDA